MLYPWCIPLTILILHSIQSSINLQDEDGKADKVYEQLDKYLLPKSKWTIESLILIMTIVAKAFNCTNSCICDIKASIDKKCVTSSVAGILHAAFVPVHNPIYIEDGLGESNELLQNTGYKAVQLKRQAGTHMVSDLSPNKEASAPDHFYRITLQGISPYVQNLLLPMGLQKISESPSKFALCPFVVGKLNNRHRTDTLIDKIMFTLFQNPPELNLSDMFSSMVLAKTSFSDKIVNPEKIIPMQPYEPKREGNLFGSRSGDVFNGLIVANTSHDVDLDVLFELIGNPPTSANVLNDVLVGIIGIHERFCSFKIELENALRNCLKESKFNPVGATALLFRLIKGNSGGIMQSYPFFPNVDQLDTAATKCELPYIFQICKVLLQGQSSLVDQLLEGNHRQACVSNALGNFNPKSFKKGRLRLSLHLLFQDSMVIQVAPMVIPNIPGLDLDSYVEPTLSQVR